MSQTYQLLFVSRNTSAAPSSMSPLPHLFSDKMTIMNAIFGVVVIIVSITIVIHGLSNYSLEIQILNLWINGPKSNTIGH